MTEDKVSQLPRKFYGKKDAIRDPKAVSRMKKIIFNYDGGEGGEGGESVVEKEISETSEESEKNSDDKSVDDPKFHIKIDGASYDIIGDKSGKNLTVLINNDNDDDDDNIILIF